MPVTVHSRPVDTLSQAKIDRWNHIPVAIAADVSGFYRISGYLLPRWRCWVPFARSMSSAATNAAGRCCNFSR